jgi:xanthine/CO dehydrogenase XdhC/CoxF family maturation factor
LILKAYAVARERGLKCALATVVRITGSSFRTVGAKMLITEEGEISGSVSGGCLERDLIRRAILAMRTSERRVIRYDTRADVNDDNDGGGGSGALIQSAGLGCEGVIEIFLDSRPEESMHAIKRVLNEGGVIRVPLEIEGGERFEDVLTPPVRWTIFGAGHSALAVARLARELGWNTTVVDCRSAFPIPKKFFAECSDRFLQCEPERILEHLSLTPECLAVLMTHNYEHDRLILERVLPLSLRYVGLLGPRKRSERLLGELEESGLRFTRSGLRFPVGLDIGGDGPAAIALSILAEAQAVLSGRAGGALGTRAGPIHEHPQ